MKGPSNLYHFEPYSLKEFYVTDESPQVVIQDDTVYCKHFRPNVDKIVDNLEDSVLPYSLLARVVVEKKYFKTVLNLYKEDIRAVYTLEKLLSIEEALLELLTKKITAEDKRLNEIYPYSGLFTYSPDLSYGKEQEVENIAQIFKNRVKLQLEDAETFSCHLTYTDSYLILRMSSVYSFSLATFNQVVASRGKVEATVKTLRALVKSPHLYNVPHDQQQGVSLGFKFEKVATLQMLNTFKKLQLICEDQILRKVSALWQLPVLPYPQQTNQSLCLSYANQPNRRDPIPHDPRYRFGDPSSGLRIPPPEQQANLPPPTLPKEPVIKSEKASPEKRRLEESGNEEEKKDCQEGSPAKTGGEVKDGGRHLKKRKGSHGDH